MGVWDLLTVGVVLFLFRPQIQQMLASFQQQAAAAPPPAAAAPAPAPVAAGPTNTPNPAVPPAPTPIPARNQVTPQAVAPPITPTRITPRQEQQIVQRGAGTFGPGATRGGGKPIQLAPTARAPAGLPRGTRRRSSVNRRFTTEGPTTTPLAPVPRAVADPCIAFKGQPSTYAFCRQQHGLPAAGAVFVDPNDDGYDDISYLDYIDHADYNAYGYPMWLAEAQGGGLEEYDDGINPEEYGYPDEVYEDFY